MARFLNKDLPSVEILEFSTIMTYTLFYATHTNIINFDFSKKSYDFSSLNYKKLRYQIWKFPRLRLVI